MLNSVRTRCRDVQQHEAAWGLSKTVTSAGDSQEVVDHAVQKDRRALDLRLLCFLDEDLVLDAELLAVGRRGDCQPDDPGQRASNAFRQTQFFMAQTSVPTIEPTSIPSSGG